LPSVLRFAVKVERSRGGEGPRAHVCELSANARLDIAREWDVAAEDMKIRRLVPMEAVREIQLQ
jgi:hypothetical protein